MAASSTIFVFFFFAAAAPPSFFPLWEAALLRPREVGAADGAAEVARLRAEGVSERGVLGFGLRREERAAEFCSLVSSTRLTAVEAEEGDITASGMVKGGCEWEVEVGVEGEAVAEVAAVVLQQALRPTRDWTELCMWRRRGRTGVMW